MLLPILSSTTRVLMALFCCCGFFFPSADFINTLFFCESVRLWVSSGLILGFLFRIGFDFVLGIFLIFLFPSSSSDI